MLRKAIKLLSVACAGAAIMAAAPANALQYVIWYDAYWNQVGETMQLDNNYICWSHGTYGPNYQWFYYGSDSGNPADCPPG